MSGKKAATTALTIVGNTTLSAVRKSNGSSGAFWVSAIDQSSQATQRHFPEVDSMKIHGAQAHQSHTVDTHTDVLSVAYFAGNRRVVSGHVHLNGTVDYSKASKTRIAASSSHKGYLTGLDWRTDPAGQAEFWDGNQWQPGEWSEGNQLWTAHHNGAWYAWV